MNEKEINAWLRIRLAELDTRGMELVTLAVYADATLFVGANAYGPDGRFHCFRGDTVAEAFAKLRAAIPADPCETLRAEAARLLAKADALEDKP